MSDSNSQTPDPPRSGRDPPADLPADLCARHLLRSASKACLATLDRHTGEPYASLVMIATDAAGRPLLLISKLALHTQNMLANPRASLLVETSHAAHPLAEARLTVQGEAVATQEPEARRRFLNRHPQAAGYAGFTDFAFVRIDPARGHFIGGFGRIVPLSREELLVTGFESLAQAEADIVAHMNADHADVLALYATRLNGAPALTKTGAADARRVPGVGNQCWSMTGMDTEGIDLKSESGVVRIGFARPVHSAEAARAELVGMAQVARSVAK